LGATAAGALFAQTNLNRTPSRAIGQPQLTVATRNPNLVEGREFNNPQALAIDEVAKVDCDVFAPCALGAGLNDDTIPYLRAKIVAGAANNQLAETRHGDDLYARGILYAPDYAINAGGLVNVAQEVKGYDAKLARERTLKIYDTIWEICERSKKLSAPTYKVADILVEEKLSNAAR